MLPRFVEELLSVWTYVFWDRDEEKTSEKKGEESPCPGKGIIETSQL